MPRIPRVRQLGSEPAARRADPTGIGLSGVAAEGRATRALAGTVADMGETLGRIRARQLKQDALNNAFEAQTRAMDEWQPFLAEELAKRGKDTYGNYERLKEKRNELIGKYGAELEDGEAQELFTRRFGGVAQAGLWSAAELQSTERKAVTVANLDAQRERLASLGYTTPASLEANVANMDEAYDAAFGMGMISEDERDAGRKEDADYLARAAITGLMERDPGAALKLLDEGKYNKYLAYGSVKELRKQAKDLKTALEDQVERDRKLAEHKRKRAEEQEIREWKVEALEKFKNGELTEADIYRGPLQKYGQDDEIAQWVKRLDDQATDMSRFEKTKPEVYAQVASGISLDRDNWNAKRVEGYRGNGLSNDDTDKLLEKLKGKKSVRAEAAFKVLDKAHTNKLFHEKDKAENSRRWGEFTAILNDYIENNPDGDPLEFTEKIMEPVKVSWVSHWLDLKAWGEPYSEREEEMRRQEKMEALTMEAMGFTQEDLEFTAQKRNMTVQEVKEELGIAKRPAE